MGGMETRTSKVKAATVSVNGAEIYHEVRGSGPPVLVIQGATGDGGTFEQNAGDENLENLAPELRERMLGNAEVFFFTELEAFVSYVPESSPG